MKKVEILKAGPVCLNQTGAVCQCKVGDIVEVTEDCARILVKNVGRYHEPMDTKAEKKEPENKMQKDVPENKSENKSDNNSWNNFGNKKSKKGKNKVD